MSRRYFVGCVSWLGLAMLGAPAAFAGEYRISGPYTHDNLSIFLIHDSRQAAAKRFLTLQEAMDQKKVAVYETGSVNELSIENLSSEDVYVQSGDIVKGGRQDRVFPTDFVITSHSGKVPIASFCVERGRWSKRGAEAADQFSGSTQLVATKTLKMAARGPGGQTEVWNQVANAQASLASVVEVGTAGAPASASPTSMQLSLEGKQVREATDAYVRHLTGIVDGRADAVGFAFAVNGQLSSADIYSSSDLFRRMWPKLLKASAVEAMTERRGTKASSGPDASAVRALLADAGPARESSKEVARRLQVVTRDSGKTVLFETRDHDAGGAWLHKSYIVK